MLYDRGTFITMIIDIRRINRIDNKGFSTTFSKLNKPNKQTDVRRRINF